MIGGAFIGCMLAQQGGATPDPLIGTNALVLHFDAGEVAAGTAKVTLTNFYKTATSHIDWGDGTYTDYSGSSTSVPTHTYTADGDYIVKIDDNCTRFAHNAQSTNGRNHLRRLYAATITNWNSAHYFAYNRSLTFVDATFAGTTLGGAFSYCSSLKSLPDMPTITSIGDNAFIDCSALESVGSIPNLASVGRNILDGCSSLRRFNSSVDGVADFAGATFAYVAATLRYTSSLRVALGIKLTSCKYDSIFRGSGVTKVELVTEQPPLTASSTKVWNNYNGSEHYYVPDAAYAAYAADTTNAWASLASNGRLHRASEL